MMATIPLMMRMISVVVVVDMEVAIMVVDRPMQAMVNSSTSSSSNSNTSSHSSSNNRTASIGSRRLDGSEAITTNDTVTTTICSDFKFRNFRNI